MTLNEFYIQLKSDLKSFDNFYKGFVIAGLSLPNFERNKKGIYNNSIYVDALSINQSIKLLINLNILEAALKDGYTINENVGVDITIDSISLDSKGIVLIKISKIVESGISEQELFVKNLTAYCNENNLFRRIKKRYPTLVKKIALISTNNTNTLEDIMKNLNYTLETSSFKVQSTSIAIAEQIRLCNDYDYDLILLYRGGHEDKSMNIYSDIPVLNAINESNIHTGVALGHEVDTPFVYKIADSTYSTPTNFAQVINNYNQEVKNQFTKSINNIKNGIENLKNSIEANLRNCKISNIISIKNKAESDLQLCMEKINSHTNKSVHTYELKIENSYSNIKSVHLSLMSKLQDNFKSRANRINTLSIDLIFRSNQKKNRRTNLILIAALVVAVATISYLTIR